jgi:DNA-binding MarR family transcriptional regulator
MSEIYSTRKRQAKFFGFFMPEIILTNKRLSPNEKLILAYILSITKGKRAFFASNEYIQVNFGVSKATASKAIGRLEKLGFIELKHFDGRNRNYIATDRLERIQRAYSEDKSRVLNNSIQPKLY